MSDQTSIPCSKGARDACKRLKAPAESWDSFLARLVKSYETHEYESTGGGD